MAGQTLNINSILKCPHGGKVQIISANNRVKVGGAFAALATDQFVIVGCPFQIPAAVPIPSPCVTVRWLVNDLRAKVNQTPTLSQSSVGICMSAARIPQGPVMIVNAQKSVKSQ
jgi:hypothetical protein